MTSGLFLLILPDIDDLPEAFGIAGAVGFQLSLIIAMAYGLGSVAQHWLIRVALWRAGTAPLRYGRWLDYAVLLKLLYRSAGGYVFIHGLLQEHFAQDIKTSGRMD